MTEAHDVVVTGAPVDSVSINNPSNLRACITSTPVRR